MSKQSTTSDREAKIKEIQECWRAASIGQFVSLYREVYKLPEIELEDLEDGLVDEDSVQRKIIIQLIVALLRGINYKTKLDNWEILLQKFVQKNFVAKGYGTHDPYLINIKEENQSNSNTEPPVSEEKELKREISEDHSNSRTEEGKGFKKDNQEDSLDDLLGLDQEDSTTHRCPSDFWKLEPSIQIDIIYFLCEMRVDRSDTVEAMKKMDADALRAAPLGSDKEGNEYWYFYGTRLYKQTPAPLKKERSWEDEWKKQKEQTFKKRRPGRPPKRTPGRPRKSDGESEELDSTVNNRRYMNIEEKSRWCVVCNVIEDWFEFAEKFKDSEYQCEKALFTVVQENFLPALCDIYEEKERRIKQKIKELIPKRTPVVTRMETRKHRTPSRYVSEFSDSKINQFKKEEVRKSRADRLEERNNRRVSEIANRSSRNKDKYYNEDSDDLMDTSNEDEYVQKYYPLYSDGVDIKPAVMKLMSEVRLHKDAWPFINPVKKEEAPGYYEIISQPIDLSIISQKLMDGRYQNLDGLDADFRKLIMNCRLYNGEHSGPTRMVNSVYKMFTKGLEKIFVDFGIKEEPEEDYYSDEPAPKSSRRRGTSRSGKRIDDKRKKRKVRNMDAIEVLSHATEMSLKKQDQNNHFESLQYSGFQQNSSFSDLKIIPIHSNPSEIIEKLTSNKSNQNEEDANNNESSSDMEREVGNSTKDFDLGSSSNSLSGPADYGYFESPNDDDHSDESVFTDKDNSENASSQSKEINTTEKNSDHESTVSNSESGTTVQQRTQRNSSSSSEGLVHSMANILDQCGNQNMTNLTSGFNREPVYLTDNSHISPASKSSHSSHSDSSTPEDVRMIPKDSSPIQNSILDKHVPFLQPGLNLPNNFGSFLLGNYESSTVDASVLGFSSFSNVPSRKSPPTIVHLDHKQTTPPMQVPNTVASITTHMSPSSDSQVVTPPAVSQLHQSPVQILKPEPNKFSTVKVSLPPSTGEILVMPDKTDQNKMTFHILAQPHSNGNAIQPIQSYFDIRADRSPESSVNEKESSPTIINRRTSPVIEPSPFSTASTGMSMVSQPTPFSSLLKPATTFSNFSPNPTSSSSAPSYSSSFNPVSTNITNTVPMSQPTYQYVRPSNFNTLNTNYSPVIRQPTIMNSNIDNNSITPQAGNILRTMNPPVNSVFSNYQTASKEIKSKSISTISKRHTGNAQKVAQVATSNNILFNSNSMLTNSNGQYEFISVHQPGSRTQSSDKVMKTMTEGITSSPITTYSNPMQNYAIASSALGTPLMYAQVNPNQPSQLINIPNYMFTNQNLFQHPMNPSIMNIQPFQVPTRPIISMDMSNR